MCSEINDLDREPRFAEFAGFRLDLQSYQLYRGRERIALPARAGKVLALLSSQYGVVVDRPDIQQAVWGDRHLDHEASLNTAIRSIRRALGDDATKPIFIETVPRHGYRFIQQPRYSNALPGAPEDSGWQRYRWALAVGFSVLTAIGVWRLMTPSDSITEELDGVDRSYLASPGYESFLQGRYALASGNTEQAEDYLRQAIAADGQLAPAYISLARVHVSNRRDGWKKIAAALELAEQAIDIDDRLVPAHALKAGLALYYFRDPDLARRHVEKALSIAPNEPDALVVNAYLNVIQGNTPAAVDAIAKAHQIRPLSVRLNADYGWVLYKAGNWNDAERLCKASVTLNDLSPFALSCVVHINHSQGDYAEAAEFGLRLMALYGASADEIEAIRMIDDPREREKAYWQWTLKWLDNNQDDITDARSKKAIALTMLGRNQEAIDVFEQAYEYNGEPFLAFLAVDPRVDELRLDREFETLATLSKTSVQLRQD